MSIRAMNWAWDAALQPSAKLVLMALADHADNAGVCWPGHAAVSEKTGISERHVIRIIKRLETDGFLVIRNRRSETHRQMVNFYYLSVDGIAAKSSDEVEKPGDILSCGSGEKVQKPGDICDKSRVTLVSPGTTKVLEPPIKAKQSSITSLRASARAKENAKEKIQFDENSNAFTGIPDEVREKWRKAYSHIDVARAIFLAECWWITNAKKSAGITDVGRFLNGWLARDEKQAAENAAAPSRAGYAEPEKSDRHCCHAGGRCVSRGTSSLDGRRWFCTAHSDEMYEDQFALAG